MNTKSFLSYVWQALFLSVFVVVPSLVFAQATPSTEETLPTRNPEFMRNWLIPDKNILGATEAPNSTNGFSTSTSGNVFSGFTVESPNSQKRRNEGFYKNNDGYKLVTKELPLSPWLIEHGFSWDDDYEAWKSKLGSCSSFALQESDEPYYKKSFSDGVLNSSYVADLYVLVQPDENYVIHLQFTCPDYPDSIEVKYNSKGWGPSNFSSYDTLQRHQKGWNAMSVDEQNICALSGILINLNSQYVEHFNPAPFSKNNDKKSREILADSWDVQNKEELLAEIEDLQSSGHDGAYRKIVALDDKYADTEVLDIARKECLSVLDVLRLYFVRNMREKIGDYGLSAWDDARCLTLLRWGVACGMLTEEEALEKGKPIADNILQTYVSFEDFAAHYSAGRAFLGLRFGNYESYVNRSVNSALQVEREYPVDSVVFTGKASASCPVMSYAESWYEADEDSKLWDKAVSLYYQDEYEKKDLEELLAFPEGYSDIPCFIQLWMYITNGLESYENALSLCRTVEPIFSKYHVEDINERFYYEADSEYNMFYLMYAYLANIKSESSEALYALSMCSDSTFNDGRYNYEKGNAYANLIGTSPDYEENEAYAQKAWSAFIQARDCGFELPEGLLSWLESIGSF